MMGPSSIVEPGAKASGTYSAGSVYLEGMMFQEYLSSAVLD